LADYDAFISYSHARDKPIAAALQGAVQRLGKPWYRRRALRVFRDDTSLSAAPQLWPAIEQALARSRFLILLASPEAAASPWVGKEIEYWLAHKSIDTLLIALTDGTLAWEGADFRWSPATPLPPLLQGRFPGEPKWVDLCAYRAGAPARRDPRFAELAADFAAAIRGVPKEDLLSEELRQQRRALTLAWSAAGLLLVLAALAAWQAQVAIAQRDRAERTLTAATGTAESLTIDMAQEFRNRTGMPADLTRKILDRAEALLRELTSAGEDTPYLRRSRGVVLIELAKTYLVLGDSEAALAAARQARELMLALRTSEWQRDLSIGNDLIGEALVALGRREEALAAYQESLGIRERLAAAAPADRQAQRDLAVSLNRVAGLLTEAGRREEALTLYRRALELALGLAADPADAAAQRDVATSHERIAGVLFTLGRHEEALQAYRASLAIFERIAAGDAGDAEAQRNVWVIATKLGDALFAAGEIEPALDSYRKGLAIAERLAAADPGNRRRQRDLSISLDKIGDALAAFGRHAEALAAFRRGFAISAALAAADEKNAQWQLDLSVGLNKIGDALLALGRAEEALADYRRALAIVERLTAADPGNLDWQRELSVTWNKMADALAAAGRRGEAIEFARRSLALRTRLATADPANVRRQIDLVVVLAKLAQLGDDARARLREALAILRRLEAEGRLPAYQKGMIAAVERMLAEAPN
jgi:tetratricopeptide (TPR) repeat protein